MYTSMEGVTLDLLTTHIKQVLYNLSIDYGIDYSTLSEKFLEVSECTHRGCNEARVKGALYCKTHIKEEKKKLSKKVKKVSEKANKSKEKLFHTHPPGEYEKDCRLCGMCGDFCNPDVTTLPWVLS